jgi:hypothetical protein
MRIAAILVLAGALVMGAWTWGASSSSHVASLSPTDRRIEAAALKIARELGDSSPTRIAWVASRHRAAERVASGDLVDTNVPVYLVALRGRFIDRMAPVPPGGTPPRGRVLTLTLDRGQLGVLDLGLSSRWPHLARLGRVHQLRPRPA